MKNFSFLIKKASFILVNVIFITLWYIFGYEFFYPIINDKIHYLNILFLAIINYFNFIVTKKLF